MGIWIGKVEQSLLSIVRRLIDSLFTPITSSKPGRKRFVHWIWILGFLFSGYMVFVVFFNLGRIPFEIQDWPKEWQYYSVLKHAVSEGIVPLHFSPAILTPDRFLAIPETVLSPQIILLKFLDQGQFVLINTLFLYSIGFLGCLLLGKRYHLSPFTFGIMVLLFSFNGHIMTHLSVGHSMWLGYYFLPFFFLSLFRLLENDHGRNWSIWMGLTLFAIILQGSIHIFVWCVFTLILLWFLSKQHRSNTFWALIVGFTLSAFRLLAAGLEYGAADHRFFPGYLSLTDALAGLIADISPYEAIRNRPIGWWELDMFIGLSGLAFILMFAIYPLVKRSSSSGLLRQYRPLLTIGGVFMMFSFGYLYLPLQSIPLPFFSLERVPSRFLIIPVVMLIFMASISLQKWLAKRKMDFAERVISITFLVFLGQDLLQHARMWRIENLARALPISEWNLVEDLRIANHPDPIYTAVLGISLGLTVSTIIVISIILFKKRIRGSTSLNSGLSR